MRYFLFPSLLLALIAGYSLMTEGMNDVTFFCLLASPVAFLISFAD